MNVARVDEIRWSAGTELRRGHVRSELRVCLLSVLPDWKQITGWTIPFGVQLCGPRLSLLTVFGLDCNS